MADLKRYTVSTCMHGLGNRLVGLINGMYYSEILHADHYIYWPQNNSCMCAFADLFCTQNDRLISSDKVLDLISNNMKSDFISFDHDINKKSFYFNLNTTSTNLILCGGIKIADTVPTDKVYSVLKLFKPHSFILESAFNFIKHNNINGAVKGLHLRYTDTAYKLLKTEKEYYEQVKSDSKNRYFVVSDDVKVENKFSKLKNVITFPTRSGLLYNPGNMSILRPSHTIIDAYMCMLILSRTSIIYTGPSSFLAIAQKYSNVDLKDITYSS